MKVVFSSGPFFAVNEHRVVWEIWKASVKRVRSAVEFDGGHVIGISKVVVLWTKSVSKMENLGAVHFSFEAVFGDSYQFLWNHTRNRQHSTYMHYTCILFIGERFTRVTFKVRSSQTGNVLFFFNFLINTILKFSNYLSILGNYVNNINQIHTFTIIFIFIIFYNNYYQLYFPIKFTSQHFNESNIIF